MGSSTPGLKRHSKKIARLTEDISKKQSARFVVTQLLDHEIDNLRTKAEEEAQKFFGLQERPQMGGGMWRCPDSPNGHCWYAAEDRDKDECIVCGDPWERK